MIFDSEQLRRKFSLQSLFTLSIVVLSLESKTMVDSQKFLSPQALAWGKGNSFLDCVDFLFEVKTFPTKISKIFLVHTTGRQTFMEATELS